MLLVVCPVLPCLGIVLDIIEHTHTSLTFLNRWKINLPRDWGTSEAPETSELKYLTRRIRLCGDPSSIIIILEVIVQKYPQIRSLHPRTIGCVLEPWNMGTIPKIGPITQGLIIGTEYIGTLIESPSLIYGRGFTMAIISNNIRDMFMQSIHVQQLLLILTE